MNRPPLRVFRDLPLRYKVLAGGILPLLLAVGIGGILATRRMERTIGAHLDVELANTTALITGMVRVSAETSIRNHLRSVAESHRAMVAHLHALSLRGELTEAEAKRRASALLLSQRVGDTGYLYALDPEGTLQVHPTQSLVGAKYLHLPAVRQQTVQKEGYLEYDWQNPGEPEARPKALYMVPFEPWNWIISASSYRAEFTKLINVEDFRNRVRSVHLGSSGYPFVMDTQGNLIIHPRLEGHNLEDERDPYGRAFLQEIRRRRSGSLTYPWQGAGDRAPRLKRCHFQEIPELGWIVGSTFSVDEAFGPVRALTRTLLLLLAIAGLVAIPITFWISGRITRPLSRLAAAFSHGPRAGAPVAVSSQDEVGRLAAGFNDFMALLQRSQADLIASEARFRGIVENTAEGLIRSTPDGRLIQANPALARQFGYPSPEALLADLGADVSRLYAEPSERARVLSALQEGGVQVLELRFRRRDGTTFWGSLKAMATCNDLGKPVHIDALLEDVTERRQYREALEALVAQRTSELQEAKDLAERATRAKSDFLSAMSHELRTPLSAILLYADLLAEETQGATPQLTEDLEKIRGAGQHLLRLINHTLDLAKIEAGRVDLKIEPMDPRPLLEEVRLTLAPLAAQRGNHLVIDCPVDPPALQGDPLRLRQILLNLAGNAVKFTEGGSIHLRCRRAGDRVLLEVTDTGIGLSPEEAAGLFEAFHQTPEGRKRQGTGLGLALSRRLAELMGGTLTLLSRKGEGSTFTLDLPAAGA